MSQHFLVELIDTLDDAPTFARIVAPDADTAITSFLTTFAPTHQLFLDYVASTTVTLSFAESFWIQTDAEDDLFAQGQLPLNDGVFAARVQQFFGEHRDYADLYLTYYFNAESIDSPRPNFPPAMFAYIWRHTNFSELRALPVGEG